MITGLYRLQLLLISVLIGSSIGVTHEAHAVQLNSRQTGSQAIPNGQTSATVNITAVTDAKSFLVFGVSVNGVNPTDVQVSGQITNCTTRCDELTFQRVGTTDAVLINWYVVEFVSGVTVQRGNVSMDAATKNVLLSSVTLSQSFPITSYRMDGTTFAANDWRRAKLTSSTNLECTMPDPLGGTVEWQVVVYTDATVQTGDITTWSTTSQTDSITSVDLSKSWLIYTYNTESGNASQTDIDENLVRGRITSATQLTFDRFDGDTSSEIDLTWYVVEFTDGTTVQHDSKNFSTSQTQQDVTLTSEVETTWAIAVGGDKMRGGRSPFELDDNPGPAWFRFSFVDKDTLRIIRGTTQSETADVGWFVIQFIANATAVELSAFTATEYADGILLQWRTGWEANNLGFHVYREAAGERIRVSPELISGSALLVGRDTQLTAGRSYTWGDPDGLSTDHYWLEDVDLDGTRTWHGPVRVRPATDSTPDAVQTVVLSQLNAAAPSVPLSDSGQPAPVRPASGRQYKVQRALANMPAVKLLVREEGWYRVDYAALVAAGLSPSANPRKLCLFADGQEQAMLVRDGGNDGKGRFGPGDSIEFYGQGVDTAWTDTRVYWLIELRRRGKRVPVYASRQARLQEATSFPATVGDPAHEVYFAALKNGETDNFFGPVVSAEPVERTLTLQAVADVDAQLNVTLQGVTGTAHEVAVSLNDIAVGTVTFSGQQEGTLSVPIPPAWLHVFQ